IESADDCLKIDENLQPGCLFRFTWMKGSSNPPVTFQEVECPQELIDVIHVCIGRDIHIAPIVGGVNGTATTYRFWGCCKTLLFLAINRHTNVQSGCDHDKNGTAFLCSDQVGIAVNETFAYGFAGAYLSVDNGTSRCCQCLLITFEDFLIRDKQMIVQIINSGGNVNVSHIDIALPGGGGGLEDLGCTYQWGDDAFDTIEDVDDCLTLPESLQPGCQFRFTWMLSADNPPVKYQEVECPQELIDITGCQAS
ncbi:hypothetical protein NQ317_018567, partial [Molorchus minor]